MTDEQKAKVVALFDSICAWRSHIPRDVEFGSTELRDLVASIDFNVIHPMHALWDELDPEEEPHERRGEKGSDG